MDTLLTVPPAVPMTPIHSGRVRVRIAPEARRRLALLLEAEGPSSAGMKSALYLRFAPTPELLVIERPASLPPELASCDSWGIPIVFPSADEARVDGLRIEFDASGAGGGFRLVAPAVDDVVSKGLQVDSTCMSCASSPDDLGERFPLPDLSTASGKVGRSPVAPAKRGPSLPILTHVAQ